ncbi:splicing factor YJU2-like [Silurus meridionalis]|uniref:splicing factor YJU2-like n=1 Tax=Silurus meridionalis TaxID=175797 RepID=UPI001EEC18FC|nr:splicing factor YJU2-like [Silurus meridionalis]XP_046732588.1 splicing factor YJU2-like [Silurus meridionalis]
MAPFNMRCKSCGKHIYKETTLNAQKETVQNKLYLGVPIIRFSIKCTRCSAEITFKTDPENTEYLIEHGATRNCQVLENRKRDSKMEMKVLENLQEQKELNQRQARGSMLQQSSELQKRRKKQEQEEDERELDLLLVEQPHLQCGTAHQLFYPPASWWWLSPSRRPVGSSP